MYKNIFDSHAHYTDKAFNDDRRNMLGSLKESGICGVINCGADLESSKEALKLSEEYDYIVLDLPPVTAVTDALVASKIVDGLIVVVRCDYADRNSLNETLRQIRLVNGKVLGFVMTCANSSTSIYSKKYRYRYRYYKNDYR